MAKAIHSMVRVLDESRSLDFYQKALGLSIVERLEFETFVLIYIANSETDFEVELTVNKGRIEPYQIGDGYGHLAVSVDNLEAEHVRMADAGLEPGKVIDFAPSGNLVARFFFVTDPDGYKIEVIERSGRFK